MYIGEKSIRNITEKSSFIKSIKKTLKTAPKRQTYNKNNLKN